MTPGPDTPPGPDDDLLGRLLAEQEAAGQEAPHSHAGPGGSTADVSVRPAVPEDAPAIGDIHARTLRATLAAGTGAELTEGVRRAVDAGALTRTWAEAITAPPSASHRVLTACEGPRVVGFAAIAPAEVPVAVAPAEPDPDAGAPEAEEAVGPEAEEAVGPVGEILALEVPAAHGRAGHGSRLLAACADLLREQGATRVQTWAVRDDEARTRFLSSAGFAPAGVRRSLDVAGAQVVEICWYAGL